jgi:hypothetical protein
MALLRRWTRLGGSRVLEILVIFGITCLSCVLCFSSDYHQKAAMNLNLGRKCDVSGQGDVCSRAVTYMGPAYWIPAFRVPAPSVPHYIAFVVLLKYWTGAA